MQDWTITKPANKHLSVAISADILMSLPRSVLSMFLNEIIFTPNGIAMLSHLLTHLNPSSSGNLLVAISDLTCLEMVLGELSTDYMSCVRGISQCMRGVSLDQIIPLFAVASLDHDHYPGVNIWYLAGEPALIKCNLLDISGLLSSKDTRHKSLGLPISTPPATVNRMSDAEVQPPPIEFPQPCHSQTTMTTSPTDYPQPRGGPWSHISAMVHYGT